MSDDEEIYESASDEYNSNYGGSDEDEDMVDGTQESNSDESPSAGEDDMSEDDLDFGSQIPDKGKGKAHKSFEVEAESLAPKDLEASMRKDAEYVSGLFGADVSTVYVLLRSLGWNKERLVERYMDDPTKVMLAAGVSPDAAPPTPTSSQVLSPPPPTRRSTRNNSKNSGSQSQSAPFECPICCDDDASGTFALPCGHTYCASCWSTYLHTKIHNEGEVAILCMSDACKLQCSDAFVAQVLSSSSPNTGDVARYKELLIADFVSHNPALKFCPHPGCTQALRCSAAARKGALSTLVPTVTCAENHEFCFGCAQQGGHRPVICSAAKMWLKKCADDSETANWIKSNTKECPKCQSTIEKNGGCNHMTCKKCKYEFCWVCMGNWTEHGNSWYSCNRYEEKDGADARDAQSKSRASLERYLHYYNRWANHEQSARLSLDLYAKTEKKMEEMQVTSDLTWIEVQFARKAVDEICKCRMTLKWTYAMAYYLEKTNFKEIFEDNQADLEKAVEDLSELLEQPIEPDTIAALRQKMTDKTVYVSKRNEIVLDDTAKGFQEGRWKWNVPGL